MLVFRKIYFKLTLIKLKSHTFVSKIHFYFSGIQIVLTFLSCVLQQMKTA